MVLTGGSYLFFGKIHDPFHSFDLRTEPLPNNYLPGHASINIGVFICTNFEYCGAKTE